MDDLDKYDPAPEPDDGLDKYDTQPAAYKPAGSDVSMQLDFEPNLGNMSGLREREMDQVTNRPVAPQPEPGMIERMRRTVGPNVSGILEGALGEIPNSLIVQPGLQAAEAIRQAGEGNYLPAAAGLGQVALMATPMGRLGLGALGVGHVAGAMRSARSPQDVGRLGMGGVMAGGMAMHGAQGVGRVFGRLPRLGEVSYEMSAYGQQPYPKQTELSPIRAPSPTPFERSESMPELFSTRRSGVSVEAPTVDSEIPGLLGETTRALAQRRASMGGRPIDANMDPVSSGRRIQRGMVPMEGVDEFVDYQAGNRVTDMPAQQGFQRLHGPGRSTGPAEELLPPPPDELPPAPDLPPRVAPRRAPRSRMVDYDLTPDAERAARTRSLKDPEAPKAYEPPAKATAEAASSAAYEQPVKYTVRKTGAKIPEFDAQMLPRVDEAPEGTPEERALWGRREAERRVLGADAATISPEGSELIARVIEDKASPQEVALFEERPDMQRVAGRIVKFNREVKERGLVTVGSRDPDFQVTKDYRNTDSAEAADAQIQQLKDAYDRGATKLPHFDQPSLGRTPGNSSAIPGFRAASSSAAFRIWMEPDAPGSSTGSMSPEMAQAARIAKKAIGGMIGVAINKTVKGFGRGRVGQYAVDAADKIVDKFFPTTKPLPKLPEESK